MRTLTDGEQEIIQEIEQDACNEAYDDYNPLDDPNVHIPCERCHAADACAIIDGVVVCGACYPAAMDAWHADHTTPELRAATLTDLDDVPF